MASRSHRLLYFAAGAFIWRAAHSFASCRPCRQNLRVARASADDVFDELLSPEPFDKKSPNVQADVEDLLESLRQQAVQVWSTSGGDSLLVDGKASAEYTYHLEAFTTKTLAEGFGRVLGSRWEKRVVSQAPSSPPGEGFRKKDAPSAEDEAGQVEVARAQLLQAQLVEANAAVEGRDQVRWAVATDEVFDVREVTKPPEEKLFDSLYSQAPPKLLRCLSDGFATSQVCRNISGACITGMHGLIEVGGQSFIPVSPASLKGLDLDAWTDCIYDIIERTRHKILSDFSVETKLFVSSAMLTRLRPSETVPESPYWVPHVDKANVASYDYSALLYLSTAGEHFEGGDFAFLDADQHVIVEPRRGRLLTFTAGLENVHQVRKVTAGTRFALAMWFTLSESHAGVA